MTIQSSQDITLFMKAPSEQEPSRSLYLMSISLGGDSETSSIQTLNDGDIVNKGNATDTLSFDILCKANGETAQFLDTARKSNTDFKAWVVFRNNDSDTEHSAIFYSSLVIKSANYSAQPGNEVTISVDTALGSVGVWGKTTIPEGSWANAEQKSLDFEPIEKKK